MQNVRKVGEVEVQGEVNRWLLAQTGGARDKGLGRAGGLQRQQARMSDDARLDSTGKDADIGMRWAARVG